MEDMAGETVQAVRNPLSALMHLPGKALGVARSGFHQVEEGVSWSATPIVCSMLSRSWGPSSIEVSTTCPR